MVVVDSIDDFLLAFFQNAPNGATNQVSSWQWRYLKALTVAFQVDGLRVLQVGHFIKGRIDIVQAEELKVFGIRP